MSGSLINASIKYCSLFIIFLCQHHSLKFILARTGSQCNSMVASVTCHLLPPKRHDPQMAKLRKTFSYIPFARTNKFKTRSSCMHYIITFNLLLQFTQCIHYPLPPFVYYFIVLYIRGCIYGYFNTFFVNFIVCISSCNFL